MEQTITAGEAKIPVIGLGTASLCDKNPVADVTGIVRHAISLGITHIDTAEGYSAGLAEEAIGEAIKSQDRKKIFITTKVGRDHLNYNDVIAAAKNSLRRLKTNYIDLYLVHAPNPKIPLKETMRAMDFLVEQKLVRFIGVSNFSVDLLNEAQSHTKNKIVANQVEYNLLWRGAEKGLLQHCQKNGIILIAYTPLARGLLAKPGFNQNLDHLAEKYGKTQAQIALNWLLSHKNVVVIPQTAKAERLAENLGALGWQIADSDAGLLDKKFTFEKFQLHLSKLIRMIRKRYKRTLMQI